MSSTPTATPPTSKFAVSAIPAFKASYAQKAKLSPPAVKDATATVTSGASAAATGAAAAVAVAGNPAAKKASAKEGVTGPAARAPAARAAADSAVAFGNVNDKTAPVSSSPAAPPSFNGNPKAFGTVPAVSTTSKAPIDLHSFFTGGGSPSLSPASIPAERRSVATFDPSSRSPQPSPSVLGGGQLHPSQLSGNSQTFAPRGQPPIPFVPQQQSQQQAFPSPSPQFAHPHLPPPAGYQHGQQQHQPGPGYLQHKSTPSQNIPNGAPLQQQQSYGGPGGVNSPSGGPGQQQRNGQFGSPVMQQRQPQTPNRGQFGPTSPRTSNAGLPQGGMMGYPPQWQGQQPGYGGPPQYPYYAQQQGFPPNFVPQQMQQQQQQQQQGGPQSIPLPITSSGASTPSVGGVRTPSTVGPSSPAAPLSMGGPPSLTSNTSYNSYSSPQPQSAVLPHHPLSNAHSPYTPTSLRAPQSPFSLSGAANAAEFRPNVDAPTFVLPSPRKSAAIQIRNPKTMPKKEVVAEATPAVAEVKVESKDAAAAVVADETAAAAAAKNAAAAKVIEEKKAADALAEKARVEKEAADAKDKADKEAKVAEEAAAAATAAAAVVAAAAAAAVAAEAAAAVKVVEEKKVEDSAAAAAKAAPAAPATPVLPSFLPAKPAVVESAPTAPTPAAAASTPTEGAHSTDISVESEPGKYRYDRDFLVQFMLACMEKADHLPNLEAIGMVDGGGDSGRSSSFAGSRRTPSQMGPPAVPVRGSSGAGFTRNASGGAFGGMGNFGVSSGASPLSTSQARFEASAGGGRSSSGQFPVRPGGSMSRQGSQSGIISAGANFVPSSSNQRVRSVRGQPREENKRGGGGGGGGGGGKNGHVTGQGFEDAPPLVHSAERWMPTVVSGPTATAADPDSPEMVVRKVKALLNKLTLEKFDSISDQILAWADKSVNETDGRILRQVIALIFEKATDEANWSEMYARLCRKLMEMVSVNVKDDTVKGPDGSSVAGGALFRKYLLNRCQEDYESGWKLKEVAAAAAAGKAADDHAKKEANDAAKKEEEEKEGAGAGPSSSSAPKEAELLSDEYYAAQKAKRRGLGLVRFIGELFQLTMLTERIMHECIKKLLANTTDPEEEDVESLCRLLTTIGKSLDVPKAKQHMDIYFGRMKTIADNMKISSRIRFMIQDVLELRSQRWQPRHDSAGPKLISEIHSDAQRATEEASRRTASSSGKGMPRLQDQLSRPNSRRGQGRDGQFGVAAPGADGWSAPVPQRQAKAGDLSSFGKIREPAASISLGPSGAFANRARAKEAARPVTPSNPFAILSGGDASADASVSQRPVLNLLRRTKPMPLDGAAEEEKPEEEVVEEEEEEEDDGAIDPNAISMSRAEGERRADNSVKEFFAVKNLAEGVASVEALPVEYRGFLIGALADAAINKKADDVNLARQLFAEIVSKKVVGHAVMLASFTGIAKGMVDLAVDIPGLYAFTAQLLVGAGASRAEVEELSLKMESEEEEEEEVQSGRKALLAAFDKLLA